MQKIIFAYLSTALVLAVLAAGGLTALLQHFGADIALPLLLLALAAGLIAGYPLAKRLAARLAAPLNRLSATEAENGLYDELSPLARTLSRQRLDTDKALAELKRRADTVQLISGHMREGLIMVDREGLILSANQSARDIFDATAMDKNLLTLCRDIKLWQKIRHALSGAGGELLFTRESRVYNVYLNPVYHGPEISGAILLFLDVTESQRAERQRREFSANVSHELKTPLSAISACAEMIAGGMVREEDIPAFAQKINAQARRLAEIIEDVIRLSEFDESRPRAGHNRFNLRELAESVLAALSDKARERGVRLELNGGEVQLTANERMIDELLFNLVENAVKYNVEGGQVTLSLARENSLVKITVADTGIGIAPEHQPHVFERFYRADKSRSAKTGGSGLGLSIVKHIAEYHKGRVELVSGQGVGTTITCILQDQA